MSRPTPTTQRSFRLRRETLGLLDRRAAERGESGNRLAGRLLDEALRTDGHPLIGFRSGANGARVPALVGTRLRVAQVVQTLSASEGDTADAAGYLGIEPRQLDACIDYYAEFQEEIDEEIAADLEFARREQERVQRRREAIA